MKIYKLYIILKNGYEIVYHCYLSSDMAIKTAKLLIEEEYIKAVKVKEIITNTIYEKEGK